MSERQSLFSMGPIFRKEGLMAAENIDDISIRYEEDDKELVRELDKEILSRGSWTTIMFKYQDLDRKTDEFKPEKVSIRRYQKSKGEFKLRSKFNISSGDQAHKIINVLEKWFPNKKSKK